ncbi:MAG: cyclic nucleotide-binding domain-containing protein [Methylococcaceae bacterium]|nr:cyclic nucleotide-binding domain-containing protein [Methylococcaceae bacterium]
MAIKITLAKKPEEFDALFELRYQLLSKSVDKAQSTEELLQLTNCYINDEGRSLNRFDGYPTTSHLIVKDGNKVVGGLRLCIDSKVGVPADLVYSFRDKLPESSQLVSCDMYCVSKNYHNPRIAQGLILMASYIAISQKASQIIAPINPAIAQLMKKIGCRIVDKEMQDPATGLDFVPVILDMTGIEDFFIRFVNANKLHDFLGAFECVFYEEGDYIIRAGEKGDCVYVMVDGEANVMHAKKFRLVNTLRAGNVFGEIALLTDEGIRTANVVTTKPVRVMRLDKETFMEYLVKNPEKAMEFMTKINQPTKAVAN